MRVYRDEGLVLRTHNLSEADRIITALTKEHGKIRAVARGVRRTSSKIGSRLEPFMGFDAQLYRGKNLDTFTQVVTTSTYGSAISSDYELFTVGTAMLELVAQIVTEEGEPAVQQYLLLHGALHALATRQHLPELIFDSYQLRALAIAGWAVSPYDCAHCGAAGPHRAFSVPQGGAVCQNCRPPGSVTGEEATFELLAALLAGQCEIADVAEVRHRREVSGMVAAFAQFHLERSLRSLPLIERSSK